MNTQVLRLVTALWCSIAFLACKKEDPGTPVKEAIKNVKKVSWTSSDFASYEYNAEGKVTKHISQWKNGAGGLNKLTNIYTYDANNHLTKWSNEAGYANFSYKNGVLERSEHFAANGKKLSTLLYTFQGKRLVQLIEQIEYPVEDGVKETKISYQYNPDGNVRRIDFAYRKELTDPFSINFSKEFVLYDDKKNPEPDGVLGIFLPDVHLHLNNPLKVNTYLANGSLENYLRYEYKYHTNGFPTERKHYIVTSGIEGTPAVSTYEY